jgi:tRNA 2-thiocytidine biosynthesis protein TtcA
MSDTPDELRVERRLVRAMSRAIEDFRMIAEGDRILVAVSGGKDSYTMHHLLAGLRARAPVSFSLVAVNIDQGHPGYPGHLLTEYMKAQGHDFRMVREDTYSIVTEKIPQGKTYCSLCSRLRRGILYRLATELGCTKIALGHHRDDVVVTLLLNLFFSGQMKAMPPKLVSDDGAHVVIRPLVYCAEDDIRVFAEQKGFPILPCDLCGSQENLQRKVISRMLENLERENPGLRTSALSALMNVRPSHLLDAGLWKKLGLEVAAEGSPSDDIVTSIVRPLAKSG